nr:hypothetical protein [Devosia marina]
MRGLGVHTQHDYVHHVRRFAAFLGQSPDVATADDLRRYQLFQHESGVRRLRRRSIQTCRSECRR